MTTDYLFINQLNSNTLYFVALAFAALSAILVVLIFVYLAEKKRRWRTEQAIKESVENWITECIIEEDEAVTPQPDADLLVYFKKKSNQQFVINRLVDARKSLSGTSLQRIIHLYQHYGFKDHSLAKFRSLRWFKKARGIYELYMMNQRDMEDEIARYTNSDNEYIRMEAQTAIISFNGFDGLKFLDTLTQPVTEWHQLKLIEQLNTVTVETIEGLSGWLKSANEYVILFALKLAAVYQQLHVHDDATACLSHPSEKIRAQAISTLSRIANSDTAAILTEHFYKERKANQHSILLNLKLLADERERGFLTEQLENADDNFKLIVAEILGTNITDGLALLEQKASIQPSPYQDIYLHTLRVVN